MNLTIGAQLYTIREYTQTPSDIRKSFKKISQIGYSAVQVSGIGQIDPNELNEIANENNLNIIITHTNPDRVLNETMAVIKEHKIFNCNMVGIGARPINYPDTLEGYKSFINDFDKAAKILYDSGMKLHYHNHDFEFAKFNGITLYDYLINETNHERWAFIPDVFWIQAGGRNPARQLRDLKGRSNVCHFKDYVIFNGEWRMAEVGAGNMYWDEIIQACEYAGIKYAMVEQDDCYGVDPFDALARSLSNFINIIENLNCNYKCNGLYNKFFQFPLPRGVKEKIF